MTYPENYEVKIGFDQVRNHLKELCTGLLGQQFVDKLNPSTKFETVQKLSLQTAEMLGLLAGASFEFGPYHNVLPALKKAQIEGSFLEEAEWLQLRTTLATLFRLYEFFLHQPEESWPELKSLTGFVQLDTKLQSRIDHVLDDNGKVKDSASTELQHIRRSIIREQTGLRRRLDTLLKSLKSQDMVPDDAELTIRGGRLVIPLRAEQKRQIKGLVHDESASGQTVFIEPAEVVESNNLIRELQYEERREIVKILTQLTSYLRPQVPALQKTCTYLGMMDFIRAKARFAQLTGSTLPSSNKQPGIEWKQARHPLLHLSFQKQGRKVVPLDLSLNAETRMLVISGPNAGGKSIVLKTVGLIQYMWQCGMLVPMSEGSTMGLFDGFFIDMGDEQSLENDLSTYSSHLKNMLHITRFVTKRSLFLIDEMGTGTEPQYGGAIAETILEELVKQQAFGVVNTHYGNLKEFAERTPGVSNGAMRFDAQALTPLYLLEIGKPGSSFALEIARKIGFQDKFIQRASHKLGRKRVALDTMLLELEASKQKFEELAAEASAQINYHKTYARDYEQLKNLLDEQRKQLLNQAKADAKRLVAEANRRIELTIKQIKEGKAEKDVTRQARQELETFAIVELKAEVVKLPVPILEEEAVPESTTPPVHIHKADNTKATAKPAPITKPKQMPVEKLAPLGVGSYVRMADSGVVAQVVSLAGKDAEIAMGALKSKVKVSKLTVISRRDYDAAMGQPEPIAEQVKGIDLTQKTANFSYSLDLRGLRGSEALQELDQFLDSALLVGQRDLKILHGKGDGILRNLVRNHLRGYKQVAGVTDEHADRGGDGITLVTLK